VDEDSREGKKIARVVGCYSKSTSAPSQAATIGPDAMEQGRAERTKAGGGGGGAALGWASDIQTPSRQGIFLFLVPGTFLAFFFPAAALERLLDQQASGPGDGGHFSFRTLLRTP